MSVFKLLRKLERQVSRVGARTTETENRRIIGINPVESRPVRCITVNSPSHLYLAGEMMIPTHNTEFLLNMAGYHMAQDPAPILLMQPTEQLAKSFSKQRLAPMIRDTPTIRGKVADVKTRNGGNTTLEKSFPGGYIALVGANVPSNLAGRSIRILLADEVDRFPVSAGTEGDPLSLAEKRTNNFYCHKMKASKIVNVHSVNESVIVNFLFFKTPKKINKNSSEEITQILKFKSIIFPMRLLILR